MAEEAREHNITEFSSSIIQEAIRRLIVAANPVKVILFGSFARGDNTEGSDLDLIVILPTVTDRYAEMVGLRRALAHLPTPIDVLVYSVDEVRERQHLPGTVLYSALREGKVLHASPQSRL